MIDLSTAFTQAVTLILAADPVLIEIIGRSLYVTLSALLFSTLVGIPLGAVLAVFRFPGRRAVVVLVNSLMGLPPVVVGLIVYLLLSRSGPFGVFNLLFTPGAMNVAQTVLILPIVTALSRQVLAADWQTYRDQLRSLNVSTRQTIATLIWEARFSLTTAVLAGFGRGIAEVGAVMIVGGNIDGYTRLMTTAIALETSKGNLSLALALGLILLALAVGVNAIIYMARGVTAFRGTLP